MLQFHSSSSSRPNHHSPTAASHGRCVSLQLLGLGAQRGRDRPSRWLAGRGELEVEGGDGGMQRGVHVAVALNGAEEQHGAGCRHASSRRGGQQTGWVAVTPIPMPLCPMSHAFVTPVCVDAPCLGLQGIGLTKSKSVCFGGEHKQHHVPHPHTGDGSLGLRRCSTNKAPRSLRMLLSRVIRTKVRFTSSMLAMWERPPTGKWLRVAVNRTSLSGGGVVAFSQRA